MSDVKAMVVYPFDVEKEQQLHNETEPTNKSDISNQKGSGYSNLFHIIQMVLKLSQINGFNNDFNIRGNSGEFIPNTNIAKLLSLTQHRVRSQKGVPELINLLYEAKIDPNIIQNEGIKSKLIVKCIICLHRMKILIDGDSNNNDSNGDNSDSNDGNNDSNSNDHLNDTESVFEEDDSMDTQEQNTSSTQTDYDGSTQTDKRDSSTQASLPVPQQSSVSKFRHRSRGPSLHRKRAGRRKQIHLKVMDRLKLIHHEVMYRLRRISSLNEVLRQMVQHFVVMEILLFIKMMGQLKQVKNILFLLNHYPKTSKSKNN